MKTFLWLFPFGTISWTLFNYILATVYGILISISMIVEFIKARQKFFYVKDRPKPPKLLKDENLGEHNFVYLKSNNLKIHYVSNGDKNKPLMLFLHGFPEIWYCWRYQLPVFGKNYFAVAIDMRGYGDSDKPKGVREYSLDKLAVDVKDVVHALGKDKCVLVAHDWGGVVAWAAAAQYPELIDKLIIMNAPNMIYWINSIQTDWKQFFLSWYVFFFNLPFLPELQLRRFDLKIFDFLFKNLAKEEEIEVYKYYYSKPNAQTGPINYYRALNRGYAKKFVDRIQSKRITSPTLVIWGKNDMALLSTLAQASCQVCNDYSIKMIDDCSHWTPIDKPNVVNQYMKDFINVKG